MVRIGNHRIDDCIANDQVREFLEEKNGIILEQNPGDVIHDQRFYIDSELQQVYIGHNYIGHNYIDNELQQVYRPPAKASTPSHATHLAQDLAAFIDMTHYS